MICITLGNNEKPAWWPKFMDYVFGDTSGTLITDQLYSEVYSELLVDNNSQNVYNSSIEQQGV